MRYFDSRTSISQIGTKYSLVFEQFRLGLAGIGTSYASYPAKERFHNLRLSIQKPVCVLDIQIPTEEATNPPSLRKYGASRQFIHNPDRFKIVHYQSYTEKYVRKYLRNYFCGQIIK